MAGAENSKNGTHWECVKVVFASVLIEAQVQRLLRSNMHCSIFDSVSHYRTVKISR